VLVTPSGIFSQRYLRWALEVIGVDRILFSTDYPYRCAPHNGARRFLEEADLSDVEREKIASGNWNRICAGIRR
jgi:predicted TIM-barrel fold metal-dependent hydrolase